VDYRVKLDKVIKNGMELTEISLPDVGKAIRQCLGKGMILNLSGPMGVGKTTLIKHILPEFSVTSPSFLHVLLYGENFAHIDSYTIKSEQALAGLDLPNMLENRCLIFEWGELFGEFLSNLDAEILEVKLSYSQENLDKDEDVILTDGQLRRFIFI